MPKPDGGVHNESTVESLSLALVSAQKLDNETLFTNLYIILLIQFTKSQFLLLSLSFGLISVQNSAKSCRVSRTPSPLPYYFCGVVGGGGEEEYIATTIIAP